MDDVGVIFTSQVFYRSSARGDAQRCLCKHMCATQGQP